MADYNNVRINGTPAQQQALRGSLGNVEKYCSPDAAKQIPNVIFNFMTLSNGTRGTASKEGNISLIKLSTTEGENKFEGLSDVKKQGIVCHELTHIKKRQNAGKYYLPSKDGEREARQNERESMKNMQEDQRPWVEKIKKLLGFAVPPVKIYETPEEVEKELRSNPLYSYLPDKEPKTPAEYSKAQADYKAGQIALEKAAAKMKLFGL